MDNDLVKALEAIERDSEDELSRECARAALENHKARELAEYQAKRDLHRMAEGSSTIKEARTQSDDELLRTLYAGLLESGWKPPAPAGYRHELVKLADEGFKEVAPGTWQRDTFLK